MQKALESIFGPELLGIFSLLMMVVMIGPKVVTWWHGFRNRQKGPLDGRTRITGRRHIHFSVNPNAVDLTEHPEHGKAIMLFKANLRNLLCEAALWILPFPAIYFLIPEGQHSARLMFLLISLILASIGLSVLMRLNDRIVFYDTGMELRMRFKHHSVDYNSICRITERKSMFFWMNPSYILRLDDDTIFVLDGSYFKNGAKFKALFQSLDARVKHNTSLTQPNSPEASAPEKPREPIQSNAAVESSEKS